MTDWLEFHRGDLPLIVSFPHTGTEIPPDIEQRLVSPWFARKDTDWWVDRLYDMARELGASAVRTSWSRTVIDVNRDPAGGSLYPGQATTALCPLTTFDGEPLYSPGREPDAAEITSRRASFFEPYHKSLTEEISRLCAQHGCVVLYDAHSIRSRVPRLFDGVLPNFNIGSNDDRACAASLTLSIQRACQHPDFTQVTNGRFKGGWITRHYGVPSRGVHAVQMELACRGYLAEPTEQLTPHNWPPPYDLTRAAALRGVLAKVLRACIDFARSPPGESR
jgi:N-formylglutamate deformylase